MKRIAGLGFLAILLCASAVFAAPGGTITGTVKGPDGNSFRGAFVRAQDTKTKITTMVLSNKDGKYVVDNLAPGTYDVWATSIGFSSDPSRRSSVTVDDGKNLSFDFSMKKRPVGWYELTKYQAGVLIPDAPQKGVVIQECFNCHAFGKIGAIGRHDEDGWRDAINVMRREGITDVKPDLENTVVTYLTNNFGPNSSTPGSPADLPGYAKIKQDHDYFSDESLNIEYVDYQLTGDPRDRPGVSKEDKDGNMWSEIPGGLLRLNATTGEVKAWHMDAPYAKAGIHEILPTKDGSVWLTLEGLSGVAKFDPKTEKFEEYIDQAAVTAYNMNRPAQKEPNDPFPNLPMPAGGQNGAARSHTAAIDPQGNIWVSGRPLKKYDVETGKWTFFSTEVPDSYGLAVDQKGNIWAAELNARDYQDMVMVDPKTNKVTHYKAPGATSYRRLKIDSAGMVWTGDYFGGNATRFDPTSKTFKVFKLPGPMPTPYGFEVDHNDNVWYASMYTDVIGKLDPKTGKVIEYPTPYVEKATRDMFADSHGRIWYGAQPYFKVGYVRLRTDSEMRAALK
jgi:virginiamycin B lyase